jgi:hypothetical protein
VADLIGARRAWTVAMFSSVSMPCRWIDVMPRLLWLLVDDERHAFVGHLVGVGVAGLVRREAPADTGRDGRPARVGPGGGVGALAPARRARVRTPRSGPTGRPRAA